MRRALLAGVVLVFPFGVAAADWPQWRGPGRDDISREAGLLSTWPKSGPRLLWTYSAAGIGYSGPAIVGDRLYTMGANDGKEFVYALNVNDGQKVWSTEIGDLLKNGYGDGPRGTPTVDGKLLYAISGQGNLVCVETTNGKKRWSVSLTKDLGGRKPGWGYTESPLVDGNQIVCSPGGTRGTIAALDKNTGKTLWQSSGLTDPAGYSSIVVATFDGLKTYVQQTMKGVAFVAAKDGKLLWHLDKPAYRTAVVPTPIIQGNLVYVSAGYGAGCTLVEVHRDGEKLKGNVKYANKTMINHHGGVVLLGDYLYGYSDGPGWVCQELKTGTTAWANKAKLPKGCLTYADGHFYCYSERDGTVVLLKASPKGWEEDGRFTIPRETNVPRQRGKIWTHPVVANGRLYLRDEDLIFCFDLRAAAE